MERKYILLLIVFSCFVGTSNAQFQSAYTEKHKTNFLGSKLIHYEVDTIYLQKVISMPVRVNGYATPRMSKYESAKESLEKCIELNKELNKEKCSEEILKAQKYISIISDSINAYTVWSDSIREARIRIKEMQDSIVEAERITVQMERIKLDSIKSTFIQPGILCKNLGFITKEKLEKIYGFETRTYYGGELFYELPICSIGITYMGKTNVAASISFRLFGEEGFSYIKQLHKNGFKEIGQIKTLNFEIEPDLSSQLLNGKIIKFIKRDSIGKIICEVMCGSYFGFQFHRTK